MKTSRTKLDTNKVIVHAVASKAEVTDALDKAQMAFAQQMNLKVSENTSLSKRAREELGIKDLDVVIMDLAIEYLGPFAVEGENITPLYPPEKPVYKTHMRRGSEFEFDVIVVLKPTFQLTSYDPVEVTVEAFTLDPQEVDRELTKIADSFAKFVPDTPRMVQDNDYCVLDIKASEHGVPLKNLTSTDLTYVMNAGYMPPGFDENILGMDVNETRSFSFELPGYGMEENTDTHTIECTVTLKGIQKRIQPEMTDEWVREHAAPFGSFKELRDDTEQRLLQEDKGQYDVYLRQAVTSKLSKRLINEIPDEAYRAMQDTILNKLRIEFTQQGRDFESYVEHQGGQQQFQMILMLEARDSLVQGYALDAVFSHEKLKLCDADILLACAELNAQDPEAVREHMMQSGRGFALREMAERMKACRWLVDHAIIKTAETIVYTGN